MIGVDINALEQGATLRGGAYIIEHVLGHGGFGITYKARDAGQGRSVSIKELFTPGCTRQENQVVFPEAIGSDEREGARRKFLEEARILAGLNHPNIVRVHAFFEENNTAYMVMEFLEGRTLQELVEGRSGANNSRRRALPESEALYFVEKVGEALGAVHETNFIHRDVKPDNIMVCEAASPAARLLGGESRRVVLLDFGLNKEMAGQGSLATMRLTSAIRFGSPGYSPPEQYGRQARYGPFTDIYALGATLYFLLTGQEPPEAPERMAGEELPSPQKLNKGVSKKVSGAVEWALQLRGDERPQNVADFLHALRADPAPSMKAAASGASANGAAAAAAVSTATTTADIAGLDVDRKSLAARTVVSKWRQTHPAPTATPQTVPTPAPPVRIASPGPVVAPAPLLQRAKRHLYLNFLDLWPHLLFVLLLFVGMIYFAREDKKSHSKPGAKVTAQRTVKGKDKAARSQP